MNMEMTLKDKIKSVVSVIEEARSIQKTNPVFIPVEYFSQSSLGFLNARDVFRVLRENGAVKKIGKSWVCEEIDKKGVRKIEKTGDEQCSEDDYQAYEIEVDKGKWISAKKLSLSRSTIPAAMLNDLVFNEDGLLYSKSNPDIKQGFGKGTARYKILNGLVEAAGAFVSTEEFRILTEKKTNRQVQKEVGEIKRRIGKLLGIKPTKTTPIIEGEEYSGYRLLIKIKKTK